MTLNEFFALPDDGRRTELVRGERRDVPYAEGPEAVVASNLRGALVLHAHPGHLGVVFGVGFALPDAEHSYRVPDVAFVRTSRLPRGGVAPGPIDLVPDVAAEVLSPADTASNLDHRLADYRRAGVPLTWVVDPEFRLVTVHPADAPSYTLREGDTLTGGRVLPDFRCTVSALFEGLAPPDDDDA